MPTAEYVRNLIPESRAWGDYAEARLYRLSEPVVNGRGQKRDFICLSSLHASPISETLVFPVEHEGADYNDVETPSIAKFEPVTDWHEVLEGLGYEVQ